MWRICIHPREQLLESADETPCVRSMRKDALTCDEITIRSEYSTAEVQSFCVCVWRDTKVGWVRRVMIDQRLGGELHVPLIFVLKGLNERYQCQYYIVKWAALNVRDGCLL